MRRALPPLTHTSIWCGVN